MKQLLCVKSIMTIMVTAMLCVMVYLHPADYSELFKNVCVMIATFYFAHQSSKKGDEVNGMDWNNSNLRGNSSTDCTRRVKEDENHGKDSGN